jgi:uncharacterized protein (TIGR03000 family)
VALVLASAGVSSAQWRSRGGWYGGGWYGGRAYGYGAYYPYYGYYGYGYRPYYGSYYYPYRYGYYGYYPNYYYEPSYSYYTPSSLYVAPAVTSYQASYYSPPANNFANVEVRVPANAEIWFDGVKTNQTGELRNFSTPPLEAGRNFSYEVRARWTEDGKPVERTRTVRVRAGERTVVDFLSPNP